MDTIFALATAPGRAGVAVVRVSGPDAWNACKSLAGDIPDPRRASLRRLRSGDDIIDDALVLVFEEGESFTGEKVVEFQTHGSPAVVKRLCRALSALEGFRTAEPGEFTRRALENGRMDLAQVEGLADLLGSETEAQRRLAFRTYDGDLGRKVESWRARLLRAAALIEAGIDFADEEVPADLGPEIEAILVELIGEFRTELSGIGVAERLRAGFEVAIVGPPNVGKSTLLNRLAGREAAITSEIAGTTRDVIEVRMDIGGIPVMFLDTAGVHDTSDIVESIGVARAIERANAADIRIVMGEIGSGIKMETQDLEICPKSDLRRSFQGLGVSGRTGAGVSELLEHVRSVLEKRMSATHSATRIRHGEALKLAIQCLEQGLDWLYSRQDTEELVAESVRAAIRSMDTLVGRIGIEDVLGEIFGSFCIGK